MQKAVTGPYKLLVLVESLPESKGGTRNQKRGGWHGSGSAIGVQRTLHGDYPP